MARLTASGRGNKTKPKSHEPEAGPEHGGTAEVDRFLIPSWTWTRL
jgi:hypothetical protein